MPKFRNSLGFDSLKYANIAALNETTASFVEIFAYSAVIGKFKPVASSLFPNSSM